MRDVLLIEEASQAEAFLHPLRLELLKRAAEPRTCTELAEALGETPQKIYYHVKVLERAGALRKVEERRVRAIQEGYYQATARSFWFAPGLVETVGGRRSLGPLLGLVEELQVDVAHLGTKAESSLALSAQIRLAKPAERTAFLTDVQNAIQSIARKYGAAGPLRPKGDPNTYRLVFACYPRPEEKGTS